MQRLQRTSWRAATATATAAGRAALAAGLWRAVISWQPHAHLCKLNQKLAAGSAAAAAGAGILAARCCRISGSVNAIKSRLLLYAQVEALAVRLDDQHGQRGGEGALARGAGGGAACMGATRQQEARAVGRQQGGPSRHA